MTQKYPIIRVRATSKQVEEFYKRGGPRYLRNLLDAPEPESTTLPPNAKFHPFEQKEQNEPK
jgi:hypothetical protein